MLPDASARRSATQPRVRIEMPALASTPCAGANGDTLAITGLLGRGSYGAVYHGWCRSRGFVAVKVVPLGTDGKEKVLEEVSLMRAVGADASVVRLLQKGLRRRILLKLPKLLVRPLCSADRIHRQRIRASFLIRSVRIHAVKRSLAPTQPLSPSLQR